VGEACRGDCGARREVCCGAGCELGFSVGHGAKFAVGHGARFAQGQPRGSRMDSLKSPYI